MFFEKYIIKNLPTFQRKVENKLEVTLGKIEFRTKEELKEELFSKYKKKYGEEPDKKEINKIVSKKELFVLTEKPQNIYYDSLLVDIGIILNGKEFFIKGTLHELTHLAHLKITGRKKLERTPKEIIEGFAEYITYQIIGNDFGKDYNISSLEYDKHQNTFRKEAEKNRLKTAQDFKKYLNMF